MGYLQCILPKYLARLGHEVHVVSMPFPPYYSTLEFQDTYSEFTQRERLHPGLAEEFEGFTLHIVDAKRKWGYMRMIGLAEVLARICPDVVQVNACIGWIPMDAAHLKRRFGYKLFTGNHNSMSTSRPGLGLDGSAAQRCKSFLTRFTSGRIVSYATERCYAVTSDCAEIAWRYYGVQRHKVVTMHLGVDGDHFFPSVSRSHDADRERIRTECGFSPDDIVCVYSGKMTEEKNPQIICEAIGLLREMGHPYSALFIGDGGQKEEIRKSEHTRVLDFMHFSKLAAYYRASDIAIWPTNESTSMLDAAACGLPLIISDGVVYRDHVDGNGLVYHMNDVNDLISKLLELRSPDVRRRLGSNGAEKMRTKFSWDFIARRRINDYRQALGPEVLSTSAPIHNCDRSGT